MNQQKVQHILLRMGFGDNYQVISGYINKSAKHVFESQLGQLDQIDRFDLADTLKSEMSAMGRDERKEMIKEGRSIIKEINTDWVKLMVNSKSSFREKMAFFWHDHFACSSNNAVFIQGYLNTLRTHSLGNFGELLRAVSKSPAMLSYLNNQQNRKGAPNENFAREVMELFTLGRDNGYTERDIREAARAFTGWGFNRNGEFIVKKKQHDEGQKNIFGKTANLDGDDVIDLLLENPQTAKYISEKWVRFFVHEDGHLELEQKVAERLFSSNWDITSALEVLFTDPSFFDEKHMGTRIKSPVELLVTTQRQLRVKIKNLDSLVYLQTIMGQRLFYPPNVAGWPDGKSWVDSATLMFRLKLPQYIFKAAILEELPASGLDDNDKLIVNRKLKKLNAEINYEKLSTDLANVSDSEILQFLIQDARAWKRETFKEDSLIEKIVFITSKPEYQLC